MDTLVRLETERDQLLMRVREVLEADARMNAAWLSGSYGRGEADVWSDLDLHVSVADEYLHEVVTEHESLFAECGKPILVFGGMRSNSMPGGHFWLVQYVPYMLEVDWNIGPTTDTTRPEAALVLFDRLGIPITPMLPEADDEFRRNLATRQLAFFWAMAPLAIKFVGRGHTRLAVKQVDYLQDAYSKLWRVVWNPQGLTTDAYHQNRPLEAELAARMPRFGAVIDPLAALAVIRSFCREVESLHPLLLEVGAQVDEAVMREVDALAQIAEVAALSGGTGPSSGSRR